MSPNVELLASCESVRFERAPFCTLLCRVVHIHVSLLTHTLSLNSTLPSVATKCPTVENTSTSIQRSFWVKTTRTKRCCRSGCQKDCRWIRWRNPGSHFPACFATRTRHCRRVASRHRTHSGPFGPPFLFFVCNFGSVGVPFLIFPLAPDESSAHSRTTTPGPTKRPPHTASTSVPPTTHHTPQRSIPRSSC